MFDKLLKLIKHFEENNLESGNVYVELFSDGSGTITWDDYRYGEYIGTNLASWDTVIELEQIFDEYNIS